MLEILAKIFTDDLVKISYLPFPQRWKWQVRVWHFQVVTEWSGRSIVSSQCHIVKMETACYPGKKRRD
jgi:hypothetical protein